MPPGLPSKGHPLTTVDGPMSAAGATKTSQKTSTKAAGTSGGQAFQSLGSLVGGIMSNGPKRTHLMHHSWTQSIHANGHLNFSDGNLRSNNINATLSGADQGYKSAEFRHRGSEKITASFANFLASSLSIKGQGSQINAGSTQALEADVILDPKKAPQQAQCPKSNVRNIKADGKIN